MCLQCRRPGFNPWVRKIPWRRERLPIGSQRVGHNWATFTFTFSLPWELLFVTPWTVTHQAPLSMELYRQEYWNGVAISFSMESSWPRDWTQVSSTTGRLFTDWATREALGDTEGIKQIIILSPFSFFIILYSGWIIFCKKVLLVLKTFFLLLKMF